MKYIIDIDDVPFEKDGKALYKATNFSALVFDKVGLARMHKYHQNMEVIKAADSAWELARQIIKGFSLKELKEIFGTDDTASIMEKYTYWKAQMRYDIWKNDLVKENVKKFAAEIGIDKLYKLVQEIKDDRNATISCKCNCDYTIQGVPH